jgi:tRNA modification GTPase
MADADLVVLLLDGSQKLTAEDNDLLSQITEYPALIVFNKSDLGIFDENLSPSIESEIDLSRFRKLYVSAKTGEGLPELQNVIIEPFLPQEMEQSGFLVSDARHYDLLLRAKMEIETSLDLLERKMSEEIVLVGLHNSLRSLGQITGETTTEDMLTRIFSTFCIGK